MGLLLESSGDSPDDDLEMFSDADECRKVRPLVFVFFSSSFVSALR